MAKPSKFSKMFAEKYKIERFQGVEKVNPTLFTEEETRLFEEFKKEQNKARLRLDYDKRVQNGTAPRRKTTDQLSAQELRQRRESSAVHAAKLYKVKQRLVEFARRKGIPVPPLNKATITTLRQALVRRGISQEHLSMIENPPTTKTHPATKEEKPKDDEERSRKKAIDCETSKRSYVKRRALYDKARSFAALAPFVDLTIEQIRNILRRHLSEDEIADIEAKAIEKFEETNELLERRPQPSRSVHILDQFFQKYPNIPKVNKVSDLTDDQHKSYRAFVRQLNPETYLARKRAYDAAHRNERAEAGRQKRREDPEHVREVERRYENSEKGGLSIYFKNTRALASEKNLPFELDKETVAEISKGPCYYCDQPFERYGVDAIDNDKGFVDGNVVPCCTFCNQSKKDHDWRDFVRIMCNVAAKHSEGNTSWKFDYEFFKHDKKTKSCTFLKYISCAKVRGLRFELSSEFFDNLVSKECYYCGVHPQEYNIGVDRVNSNGHYTQDNVVGSCGPCNFMKRNASQTLFIAQAKHIYKNWSVKLKSSGQ